MIRHSYFSSGSRNTHVKRPMKRQDLIAYLKNHNTPHFCHDSDITYLRWKESLPVTRQSRNTITRWCATGSVCDRPRSGPPKKVPDSHQPCINEAVTHDDELTAFSLKDILNKKFGAGNVKYGIRTIARIRNELRWTFTSARYCQAIREANKEKHLAWCKRRINEECFQDVIFTDESTFQLESHQRKLFQKKKTPRRLEYVQAQTPTKNTCLGWDFKAGSNSPGHVWRNHECHKVRKTFSQPLSCALFGRHIQMATDYIKTMILNIQVNTFKVSFYRMTSHGRRAQLT